MWETRAGIGDSADAAALVLRTIGCVTDDWR
jgi:hypothetical protein